MRGFRFERTNPAERGTRALVTTYSLPTGNRRAGLRNQGRTFARGCLATWVSSSWSATYLLGWTQLCVPQDCQKNHTTDPEALHLTLTKNEKTDRSRIARGIVLRLRSNCKLKFQIAIIGILDMRTLNRIRPVDRCVETFRNLFS